VVKPKKLTKVGKGRSFPSAKKKKRNGVKELRAKPKVMARKALNNSDHWREKLRRISQTAPWKTPGIEDEALGKTL
jgi:hypothetical protein